MKRTLLALGLILSVACATARTATPVADESSKSPAPPRAVQPTPLLQPAPLASVLMNEPANPIVTFRLVFRAGSVDDPPGKEGLTALTAQLLAQGGTQELSSGDLMRALHPMAAELSIRTSRELTTLHGRVHKDHLARFFRIFTDVVVAPRMDAHELARLKEDSLNAIRTGLRGLSDETLGKAALASVMYRGHPYRHPEEGTIEGLENITLDDVKAQWTKLFTQDRLVIGLAGGADEALLTQLKTKLQSLPVKGAPLMSLPSPPIAAGEVLILEKKDALSTAISMGHPYGLARSDSDFFAVAFALSFLGEHRQFGGVLFRELRERRGLNYGDYAYVEHFEEAHGTTYPAVGIVQGQPEFTIWIRPVEPGHARFATRGALYFLQKLRDEPISIAEFRRARGFLMGYTRLWEQTNARKLGYALDALFTGVPSYLEAYRTAMADLTPEGVQAAVVRHLDLKRLSFAFVGPDGAGLEQALREGTPSPIRYASEKPKDLLEQDKAIAAHPIPFRANKIRVEPAIGFMEK